MTALNTKYFTELPPYIRAANTVKWSGKYDPPAIGTFVNVTVNNLGLGKVIGYFSEAGWLGVRVELSDPPAWFLKNVADSDDKTAGAFGAEIREC